MVGEVEFDGFNGVELLEAKGASYNHFLKKDGTAQPWFLAGEGFKGLLEQAMKQSQLASELNLPLVWYVAEAEFAKFLQGVFKDNRVDGIDVRFKQPTR
ncbi:Tox-REase-5 domain-containing protein [Cystobacter fuscus]